MTKVSRTTEAGCYVMDGVTYTSHSDGSETSRKATPEEVLLSNALLALQQQPLEPEARRPYYCKHGTHWMSWCGGCASEYEQPLTKGGESNG